MIAQPNPDKGSERIRRGADVTPGVILGENLTEAAGSQISSPDSGTHGGYTTPDRPGNVDVAPTINSATPSSDSGSWDTSGAGDPGPMG